MSSAEIVGDVERQSGFKEKPSMYTTVISPHFTSVSHSIPSTASNNIQVSGAAASMFGMQKQQEVIRLSKGQYAIPVRLSNKRSAHDPTKNGYENPTFIQTGESSGNPMNPVMISAARRDISLVQQRLIKAKSKKEKIKSRI